MDIRGEIDDNKWQELGDNPIVESKTKAIKDKRKVNQVSPKGEEQKDAMQKKHGQTCLLPTK